MRAPTRPGIRDHEPRSGSSGDGFAIGDGSRWRIVAIEPNESLAVDFDALWGVERLD